MAAHGHLAITSSSKWRGIGTDLPPVDQLQNGRYIMHSKLLRDVEVTTKVDKDEPACPGNDDSGAESSKDDSGNRRGNSARGEDSDPGEQTTGNARRNKPPLAFCSFIVRHHKLAFTLATCGHVFFLIVSGVLIVAGYDLFPLDFEGVPLEITDDDTYLRSLAWKYRDEDRSLIKTSTKASDIGPRTQNGDLLQVFYRAENVLTKQRLQAMHDLEVEFTSVPAWAQFCKQSVDNLQDGCTKPVSLIRFFDGSFHESLNDTTYSNIPDTLHRASQIPEAQTILATLLGKDALITATDAVSTVSRTLLYTGIPLEGHDMSTDSLSDQGLIVRKFMADNYRNRLYDLLESGLQGMSVNFVSYQIFMHDILEQVIKDMLLAGASFTFIYMFMIIQTGSTFLTVLAITSILTSFLGANLIYRVVFDYRYFGIFHVLSIFIILGIGSDNIFVFNDTWRATGYENHASIEERLSSCYRRASVSMLITSLTTSAAFIANAVTPLLGIRSFGIFSAVLVMVNFLSSIIFYPTVVIIHHKYSERWTCPLYRKCQGKTCPCSKKDPSQKKQGPSAAVRFFRGPYHRVITHRIWRWFFIGSCTAALVAFLYFVSKLEISEQGIQYYKNGNNYQEADTLSKYAFKSNVDNENIKVIISFGLRNQNMKDCHKTDYKCKGKTQWDDSLDLNSKPAQTALMNLCDKIKNLQGHDILHLQRNPVTKQVEIRCFIHAMDEYIRTAGNDPASFPSPLNLSLPTSEMKYRKFLDRRQDLYNSSVVHGNFYRYFETVKSYWLNNAYKGNLTSDYGVYSVMLGETTDAFDTAPVLSVPGLYYGTRLRYAAVEISTTLIAGTKSYKNGLDISDAWEEFVKKEMRYLPSSVQGVQFTPDDTWHGFLRQKALADTAILGIIIGVCLAFIVLTMATANIVISILATITIILVTLTIAGAIPMFGWKISVMESINLSLVVGLAVDYVVHLSDSYNNSAHSDRTSRVRDMLESMGLSVTSGALTTTGAAVFMMAAQIQFFLQFGIFTFCTIGFSILYSLCLFTPVLSIIGPEGNFGSLVPLIRWIWYRIIGRRKKDQDCSQCKGKGFCNPGEHGDASQPVTFIMNAVHKHDVLM